MTQRCSSFLLLMVALVLTTASAWADDYGPFLPPSAVKEKQMEAAKKEAAATSPATPSSAKFLNNLGSLFKPAPVTTNAPSTVNTTPSKPPFINPIPPDLDPVPPLLVEDPLPELPAHTRIDNPTNQLGLAYAANELNKVLDLQSQKKYAAALALSQSLDAWLIDATETHIDLYQVLNRVPSARVQASFEKKLGLEFAKLRDRNLLCLGELYRSLGQDRKAVRPLVKLVQSQSRTELGYKAYKILQDLGFTEALSLTQ
jgi:hypothetical protein